jgi:quercetin dioxygenase-like cupin family protein
MMLPTSSRTRSAGFASIAGLILTLTIASAQQPAVKRTTLQQGDLSIPGREAIMARAEIPAGGTTGRHTHPGEEISYVLEGEMRFEVDGQAPRTLKAGDVFMVPPNTIHSATSLGGRAAIVLATYVVEKGKPLATPAK